MCVFIPVDVVLLPKQTVPGVITMCPLPFQSTLHVPSTSKARSLPLWFNKGTQTPHNKACTDCPREMKHKSSQDGKGQHELIVAVPANPPALHTHPISAHSSPLVPSVSTILQWKQTGAWIWIRWSGYRLDSNMLQLGVTVKKMSTNFFMTCFHTSIQFFSLPLLYYILSSVLSFNRALLTWILHV